MATIALAVFVLSAFLIVTHNLDLANKCDAIIEVVDGRIIAQP